ncbi:lachesin-like isoform X2 [Biomphalaria glabrata]|uniref:Lachesin-like isoform X2 n=1 Tax=Biomphalaria glabrata TaxID=6526 RepID=A0A9W3BE49_BIOGL|nr:lachesin-like isoform X2 [Biomphalaria glabrata]
MTRPVMKRYHGERRPLSGLVKPALASMVKRDQRSGWCGAGQVLLVLLVLFSQTDCVKNINNGIDETIMTIRVVKGLMAVLPCTVSPDLTEKLADQYKVVWVSPLETLISLVDRRIINDDRMSIERNVLKDWNLHIRNVSLSDAGVYKCQINTIPVGTKKVILEVQEPPRIIDHTFPIEVERPEGEAVDLFCNATGTPKPEISWYRIHKKAQYPRERVGSVGELLQIKNISKNCADYYECVADNGVSPNAIQTFKVTVIYPPIVTLSNDRLNQHLGKGTALECYVNASPHGEVRWIRAGQKIPNDPNYEVTLYDVTNEPETLIFGLKILKLNSQDYGAYTCEATNTLGTSSATMMLYELSTTTQAPPTPATTVSNYDHFKPFANTKADQNSDTSKAGALLTKTVHTGRGDNSSNSSHTWSWWSTCFILAIYHLVTS